MHQVVRLKHLTRMILNLDYGFQKFRLTKNAEKSKLSIPATSTNYCISQP